jgi:hypothetical protein
MRPARLIWCPLADVVHQTGPVQSVELSTGEPHLLTDHQRVRPYPLGVTASEAVVGVERGGERDESFGALLSGIVTDSAVRLGQGAL